jgi:hypothetical protein
MAGSAVETLLLFHLRALKLPEPVTQHRFAPPRRWTFDFAWPDRLLYAEVEGGAFLAGGGRHNRGKGYTADCEKYSEAAIRGWRGLRATTDQVKSGLALGWIERALAATEARHG